MNELPVYLPVTNPEARSFNFYFDRLEPCLRKGRGFSLFRADIPDVTGFLEQCEQRGQAPSIIHLSSYPNELAEDPAALAASVPLAAKKFVILVQDLSYAEFLDRASVIADRLVFPLWLQRIPICFFSWLEREAYETQPIKGDDLHRDFSRVVRALLAEQVLTLLDRSNYQFASPDSLDLAPQQTIFTPIEEKLRTALEANNLTYEPQVRIGRRTVDFLVNVQDRKVIVECESSAYPNSAKDAARVTAPEGVPLCRFSAAEIDADVEKCIRTIKEAVHYRTLPAHGIDDDLDPSQREAIATVNGPIRVLAPAGSGKTKTLVNRILSLLNQGIALERILALAFNKKARDEMQDRLERRGVKNADVRTFHSFGYEIVREGLGWTFGGSSSRRTAKALMKSAILEHTQLPALRNQDPLDAFLAGLRRAKMELPTLSTVTVEYGDKIYPLEPIFHSYLKKQLSASFLDFDDMIYLAVRLLLENRELRRTYQSRFEFILVDEFQDLNETQLLLLQIIALPENNIFAVGDDDQMIYGFRGADVKHIVEFEKRFPVASTHVLNTNYRSSRMIVRHTGWLIRQNLDRVPKGIQPRRDAQPGHFEVTGHPSLLEQARFAAGWLAEHKKKNNLNWRDYAVLYRYSAYQFPIAVMLDAMGIPHSPVASQPLFQSPVGLDVYSYLQVILFPQEAKASDFERILKRPNKFLTNQLITQAKDWTSFLGLPQLTSLREWERQKLADFVTRIEQISQMARPGDASQFYGDATRARGDGSQSHREALQSHVDAAHSQTDGSQSHENAARSAADYLQMLKTEFGLAEFYREQSRISDDLDQASDEGLLDVITALAANYKSPLEFFQFTCKSMVDQESNSENTPENGNPEREKANANEVYLSTIHRAKGREFRNVVYFNLSQTAADPKQATFVEEERRVAYVGATRAKEDLLVTFSTTRPSEFLREIALNPKYRDVDENDLKRGVTSATLRLERENFVLKQLEARKQKQIASFRELTKSEMGKHPSWIQWLLNKIQLWRIDRALARIEGTEGQIKAHKEETIAFLEQELHAMKEEGNMRAALPALFEVNEFL